MDDRYQPDSDFVWLAAQGELPLDGNGMAAQNLEMLVAFTRDDCKANRDWAVMALGMYGPQSRTVLQALLQAAEDLDVDVRGEAIEAIARRDADAALPLVSRELGAQRCGYGVFVAAGLLADKTLVELLESFDKTTDAPWVDELVGEVIRACITGVPINY